VAKAGIKPVGAKIAFFGLTFKENCPDLRNTKVPDIINHLQTYGCEILISDPYADKEEAKDYYNIDLLDKNQISNCDVIIVAVAHDDYKKMSKEDWKIIFNNKGIFIDVKSIYKKDFFNNSNIKHWRL